MCRERHLYFLGSSLGPSRTEWARTSSTALGISSQGQEGKDRLEGVPIFLGSSAVPSPRVGLGWLDGLGRAR